MEARARHRGNSWERFGGLPATVVVVASYVLLGGAVLWLEGAALAWAGVAVLVAVAVHCLLRDSKGWDVFGSFLLPGVLAGSLHDLADVPSWVSYPLLVLGVILARRIDRELEGNGRESDSPNDEPPTGLTNSSGTLARS